jgi:hypothetical protein
MIPPCAWHVAASLGAAPADDEIRRAADEVFSDGKYGDAGAAAAVGEGLMQGIIQLARRLWDWFWDLIRSASGLRESNPFLYWLLIAGLVAVLVLLLWHIGHSTRQAFRRSARAPEEAAGEVRAARFRQLWKQAETLAAAGQYSEAIRQLLFALLARAAETRVTVPAGWTNREIAQRLQQVAALREPLLGFADTVDRLWYGRQAATQEDYRRSAAVVTSCVERLEAKKADDD